MSQTSRLAEEFEHVRPSYSTATAQDVPPHEQLSNPTKPAPGPGNTNPSRKKLGPRIALGVVVETMRIFWWTSNSAFSYLFRQRGGTDRNVRLAIHLKKYLLRMGPLYIKAGQVLGTQSGLLSKEATDEFRSFFADLPPMSERALRQVLGDDLPRPAEEIFESFDWQPIAVGSVAQVHRATLRGDAQQTVAVKVVKAGVRERLAASSWVLGRLLVVGHWLVPRLRKFELPALFAELKPILVGQCDMRQEAERQREVTENFRDHPFLRVPEVHLDLSGESVLVMQYMDGDRGYDFERMERSLRIQLASRLQDIFNCMVYFHGLFHVDPHPGNIMFGTAGEIILLDFGLVGRLTEDDKWNLAAFYYACVRQQWELGVERYTRAFVEDPQILAAAGTTYTDELEAILKRHFRDETSQWSTVAFFDDATKLLRRYGARASTRFSLLALSLLTGEGFVSQVDPDIDIWNNARRFTDRFSPYLSDELKKQFDVEIGDRIPESLAMKESASNYLVAPTHLDRFFLPSTFPLIIREAYGSKILDVDGNEYIDLSGGYGPHILGYAHPCIIEATQRAMAAGAVNALGSPSELKLAQQISEAFGTNRKVVFCNSGTEAVQIALRMARARTGRQRVAKFEGHYHGFSDQGMISSWFRYSGDADAPAAIANSAGVQRSVVDETLVLQYGDLSSIDRIRRHADELACVILEPMPAALAQYDRAFLQALRETCTRHGIQLIFDEVVSGFRVHYGGVQHLVDVEPDLTCLGKIIGGGLPCGAVLGRPDIVDMARTTRDPFLDVETRAFVGGTMSGNSITAAAGSAALSYLKENPDIYSELRRKTQWLTRQMKSTATQLGVPCIVKANSAIFSVTFGYATPRIVRDRLAGSNIKANLALAYYLRAHGVYMPELHTMMLSAAHSDADLARIADAFGQSVARMVTDGFFTT